ncbi:MAG: glycerophosphodiester phosphodiesterase family protein [Acidobacteriota bacterium]
MLKRISIVTILALALGAFTATASPAADPDRPATPPPTDFWQNKGFMNMAHQGGELEAPGNTLYAFKTAVRYGGADTLELDSYVSGDGVLMVTHDMKPAGTSNAPNDDDHEIRDLTLAELKQYDFAYKFTPGKGHYGYDPADPHPYRGIATGDVDPPTGYTANDFRIASFEEVLEAFPDTPINIDMKNRSSDPSVSLEAAEKLAAIMNAHPERSEDVIVASFAQAPIDKFHMLAPGHKALSGSEDATLDYVTGLPLSPTPVAVQPPDTFNLPPVVRTVPILKPLTDYDGFAIHVWGDDPDTNPDPFYEKIIDEGADGYFTQRPSVLHRYLCEAGIRRPDGSQRCAQQAPDVVPCPEGTEGEAPTCTPIPPDPEAALKVYSVTGKSTFRAGKSPGYRVLLQNIGDARMDETKVCLTVPKRQRHKVRLPRRCTPPRNIGPGGVFNPRIKLETRKKAKGGVELEFKATTADAGKQTVKKTLKIKRARK